MSNRYRVSIPVEATIRDGLDVSFTHKLEHGLTLGDLFRVRVEGAITYLDVEVVAKERNVAIASALAIAWRFVRLIPLIYSKGFEPSLAGIQAILIPVEPPVEVQEKEDGTHVIFRDVLHVSDHLRITEHISTLEPLLPTWEHVNQSNNAIADGLELLYHGKIASNERIAFLAHWMALELLVEHIPGNEPPTTVLQQYIPTKNTRKQLKREMEQVLRKYITDDNARERLIRSLEMTKSKSDIDRWQQAMAKSGVRISIEEVKALRETRGAIVHPHEGSRTLTIPTHLQQVVTDYLNALLRYEGGDVEKNSPSNPSKKNPSSVHKSLMAVLRKMEARFRVK